MSDHVHDCPKCNGYWECDKDDCDPNDLCVDCIIDMHIGTIANLKIEVLDLKERIGSLLEISRIQLSMLEEMSRELDGAKQEKLDILRGNFTQVCSYCGFEAQPPNGWDELQAHIEACEQHPIPKLRAQVATLEKIIEQWVAEEGDLVELKKEIERLKFSLSDEISLSAAVIKERDELQASIDRVLEWANKYITYGTHPRYVLRLLDGTVEKDTPCSEK